MKHLTTLSLCALFIVALHIPAAIAATPPAKKAELKAMWDTLVDAGQLYKQGKGADAAELVKKAQAEYDKFDAPGDKETQALLDRIHGALSGAHAAMQLDGIRLPPLARRELSKPTPPPKPVEPKPNLKPEPKPEPAPPAADAISFAGHVAPILLQKCGRCHVNDSKGKFNLGTYAGLLRGSEAGRVLFAGDPVGSPLVDVIESGDMPRGGGKVSPAELATLKKWIQQGAKDDGPTPDTALARLAGASVAPEKPSAAPPVVVVKAGGEGPSFGRDVAPVFVKNCTGCHGTNNPRGNFSLATFAALVRGGDSGPPIVPSKAADSLLIKKLRGQAGADAAESTGLAGRNHRRHRSLDRRRGEVRWPQHDRAGRPRGGARQSSHIDARRTQRPA